MSLVPSQIQETTKGIIYTSSFIGFLVKLIFSIGFSSFVIFKTDFSIESYNVKYAPTLYMFFTVYLILSLLNAIDNHIKEFYINLKYHFENRKTLNWIIAISFPWILSLLLMTNSNLFLNIINWSSIFLFGFVNFLLPLLLYIESLNEAKRY